FVTGNVTLQLLARGDEVRTLVRDATRGQTLARAGVTLVKGDLADGAALHRGMDGVDAVVHGAAMYSVGIAASRRPAMFEANVTGTERVLEAALTAGVPSGLGGLVRGLAGGRLPLVPFADAGLNLVHVGDVARGIVLVLDRGQPGRSYVLGGENARVADAFAALARITGRSLPRLRLPYALLQLGALVRPGLREVVTSTKGVTFWASDARAKSELGYASRALEAGP